MKHQYILNVEGHPHRMVACCANLGKPLSLVIKDEYGGVLTTDRGDFKFDVRGFEPAWCQLGFVNVTLPELGEDKEVSYFDPRVTATLLDAGLLWCYRSNADSLQTPSKLQLVDESTAWNVIASKIECDLWSVGIVCAELTWINANGKPILSTSDFDMNRAVFGSDSGNDEIARLDGLLWRLIMSLRMSREEWAVGQKTDCLAKRNEIFLAARYAHTLNMAKAYPA